MSNQSHAAAVVDLLKHREGVDVNAKNCVGAMTISLANQRGSSQIVRDLSEHIFCTACVNGNSEVVCELLKQQSVDVHAKNYDGCTSLMVVASCIVRSNDIVSM